MSAPLLGVVAAPLAIAMLLALPAARPVALALAPWAAVPALIAGIAAPEPAASDMPRLLLGMRLGLDSTGKWFLVAAAVVWTAAGVAAHACRGSDPRPRAFQMLWLLALAGNLWAIMALDVVSFYAGLALLTFAAYGLVIHEGTDEARHAGRVYVVLALLGDALMLEGLLLRAHANADPVLPWVAASEDDAFAGALLFVGLGAKAGAVGMHMWQPLAYRAVSGPVGAVLAGVLASCGLLGWIRLLPLGAQALPGLGTAVIGLGLAAAFGGALLGLLQRAPKAALAYAGISQMGLATAALGIALKAPAAWPSLAPALAMFALQYAVAMGFLFLFISVFPVRAPARRLTRAAIAPAALALATCTPAAALLARMDPTAALADLPGQWHSALALIVPLAVTGAAAASLRLLFVLPRPPEQATRAAAREAPLPPGDVIALLEPIAEAIWGRLLAAAAWPDRPGRACNGPNRTERAAFAARRLEDLLRRFATAGAALIALVAAVALLLGR
jgi:hydrogenase-4 component B